MYSFSSFSGTIRPTHHAKSSYYGRAFAEANFVSAPVVLGLLAYLLLATPADLAADVVFDDGLAHTIDYTANSVEAYGTATSVAITDNAAIQTMFAYDNSSMTMDGGTVHDFILFHDSSSASITGGSIDAAGFENSSCLIAGGNASISSLGISDNAAATLSGNIHIGTLGSFDAADITVTGGTYGTLTMWGHTTVLSDGLFTGPCEFLSSSSCISGGTFEGEITTTSNLVITGGTFLSPIELGCTAAAVVFAGSDFAINGTALSTHSSDVYSLMTETIGPVEKTLTGTLTGTLADGTPIDQTLSLVSFDNAPYGTISFIPEPASLALVAIGGGWVMRRRRRA